VGLAHALHTVWRGLTVAVVERDSADEARHAAPISPDGLLGALWTPLGQVDSAALRGRPQSSPTRARSGVPARETIGLRGGELAAARREAAMIFHQIHLVRRLSALDNSESRSPARSASAPR
jgi:hypothetical protein